MISQDDVFCHEVAKRSVARAALHLGIDLMSEEALDVLGDVLLDYLGQFGSTLSSLVESSGRTSAHVNVLDAIRTAEACTSPAVNQLHMDQEDVTAVPATQAHVGNNWKDLASFCFGPEWQKKEPEERAQQNSEDSSASQVMGLGGKSLSALTNNDETQPKKKGWNAPYFDEVPVFPLSSSNCANPHKLSATVVLSLHTLEESDGKDGDEAKEAEANVERELQGVPDDAFTTAWGEVVLDKAKKREREEDSSAPPAKRVKVADSPEDTPTENKEKERVAKKTPEQKAKRKYQQRPAYLEGIYPAFPKAKAGHLVRAVVDSEDVLTMKISAARKPVQLSEQNGAGPTGVRSSLVKLGQESYWGSGWDQAERRSESLVVPLGRSAESNSVITTAVVPLGRPSGSRISKILEGSIDTAFN